MPTLSTLPPNEEDVVAIRPSEWEKITEIVDAAIQEAVTPLLPKSGFRRVALWLKEWGGITALWAIPLALLAIVVTLGIFAANLISSNAILQTKTDERLATIESEFRGIEGENARLSLKTQASLSVTEFKATLPELRSAISTVRKQNLRVSAEVISELSKKMVATSTDATGYWPVAAELISYRIAPQLSKLERCDKPSSVEAAQLNGGPFDPGAAVP